MDKTTSNLDIDKQKDMFSKNKKYYLLFTIYLLFIYFFSIVIITMIIISLFCILSRDPKVPHLPVTDVVLSTYSRIRLWNENGCAVSL